MANERRISILIDTKGDVSGIDAVTNAFGRMENQGDKLFNLLKAGAAIDIGGRLVGSIAQIPAAMERAIERGVQFNAVLETSALGIAAVLKQFDSAGKFKTFDDAMAASASAIDLLKQKAKESPATFQSLVQSYQALAGPLSAANIPMEKQIELIVNMSQALSGLGISSQQLLQETRALVTGNINADAAAAKILGVTAADVNGAKARGQLYEFLTGKISAFAEAGKRGAGTYQTAMSNLEDAIDDVLAKVTKPIFEALTQGTLDLSAALDDPAIVRSLSDIGEGIASLVTAGYDLTTWAIENRDALILVAKAATALGLAYTAVNITQLLMGLGLKVAALIKSQAAIAGETAALGRNTAAQLANAAARGANAAAAGKGAASYGRSAAEATINTGREANAGRWAGSAAASSAADRAAAAARLAASRNVSPAASAAGRFAGAAGTAGAGAAGTAGAAIASVLTPLVIAALAGWLIKAQIDSTANARERRIEDQGNRYSADTAGNAKAMASMVTSEDKLAVYARLRTQEAQLQLDIYDAIETGDSKRIQMAEQQLKFIQLQRAQVERVFENVRAINGAEADRLRQLKEIEAFLKTSHADRDRRAKELPETQRRFEDTVYRTADDGEKLGILDRRRAELPSNDAIRRISESTAAMPAGKERDAAEQNILEINTQILEITQQRAELEKSIANKLADQAKELAKQQGARADYVMEIQIAEARAKGLDQVADRLENEKKLRDEIRRIVEATGVSEADAERAARRKLSAEWQLAQKKDNAGAAMKNVTPSRRGSGDRIGITGEIGSKGDDTISVYDNRAIGRLHQADANGRISLKPTSNGPSFNSVVPSITRPGGAGKISGGSGAGASGGDLAGAVNAAADAVKANNSPENIAKLVESMHELGTVILLKDEATAKQFAGLREAIETLTKQSAAKRSRG